MAIRRVPQIQLGRLLNPMGKGRGGARMAKMREAMVPISRKHFDANVRKISKQTRKLAVERGRNALRIRAPEEEFAQEEAQYRKALYEAGRAADEYELEYSQQRAMMRKEEAEEREIQMKLRKKLVEILGQKIDRRFVNLFSKEITLALRELLGNTPLSAAQLESIAGQTSTILLEQLKNKKIQQIISRNKNALSELVQETTQEVLEAHGLIG